VLDVRRVAPRRRRHLIEEMTVLLFSIASTPYRPAGLALVCPEARYASVAYRGAQRLDRRFARVEVWQRIDNDALVGFGAAALPQDSAIVTLLLASDRREASVQHVLAREIEVPAFNAAQVLDQELARHCVAATA
jgi:hypothetical protein